MGMMSYTKVQHVQTRIPIDFEGHPSNFKVTRSHEMTDFVAFLALPDHNSNVNAQMGMISYTKVQHVQMRIPIDFEGHPSNFKATRGHKMT